VRELITWQLVITIWAITLIISDKVDTTARHARIRRAIWDVTTHVHTVWAHLFLEALVALAVVVITLLACRCLMINARSLATHVPLAVVDVQAICECRESAVGLADNRLLLVLIVQAIKGVSSVALEHVGCLSKGDVAALGETLAKLQIWQLPTDNGLTFLNTCKAACRSARQGESCIIRRIVRDGVTCVAIVVDGLLECQLAMRALSVLDDRRLIGTDGHNSLGAENVPSFWQSISNHVWPSTLPLMV